MSVRKQDTVTERHRREELGDHDTINSEIADAIESGEHLK